MSRDACVHHCLCWGAYWQPLPQMPERDKDEKKDHIIQKQRLDSTGLHCPTPRNKLQIISTLTAVWIVPEQPRYIPEFRNMQWPKVQESFKWQKGPDSLLLCRILRLYTSVEVEGDLQSCLPSLRGDFVENHGGRILRFHINTPPSFSMCSGYIISDVGQPFRASEEGYNQPWLDGSTL